MGCFKFTDWSCCIAAIHFMSDKIQQSGQGNRKDDRISLYQNLHFKKCPNQTP